MGCSPSSQNKRTNGSKRATSPSRLEFDSPARMHLSGEHVPAQQGRNADNPQRIVREEVQRSAPPQDVYGEYAQVLSEVQRLHEEAESAARDGTLHPGFNAYLECVQNMLSVWAEQDEANILSVLQVCQQQLVEQNRETDMDASAPVVKVYEKLRRTLVHKATQAQVLMGVASSVIKDPTDDASSKLLKITMVMRGYELAGMYDHPKLLELSSAFHQISEEWEGAAIAEIQNQARIRFEAAQQAERRRSVQPAIFQAMPHAEEDKFVTACDRVGSRLSVKNGRPLIASLRAQDTLPLPSAPPLPTAPELVALPVDYLGGNMRNIPRPAEVPRDPVRARGFFRMAECVLCSCRPPSIVFSPCNHLAICQQCLRDHYQARPGTLLELQRRGEIVLGGGLFDGMYNFTPLNCPICSLHADVLALIS